MAPDKGFFAQMSASDHPCERPALKIRTRFPTASWAMATDRCLLLFPVHFCLWAQTRLACMGMKAQSLGPGGAKNRNLAIIPNPR